MTRQRSFSNAVKWAYLGNWGEKGMSSLFVVLMAGLLGPKAFGIVGIAVVYTAFLQMFLDQGFSTALIQRKDLDQQHLDAVFWMNQALALVLVGASILFSGWWAAKNHAPEAAHLISVMSLDIPILALSIVQSSILRRQMDFRSLTICTNVSSLLSGLTGLGMAAAGCGAWALVAQQLLKDAIAAVLLWRSTHWRPHFEFSWKHLSQLARFSISNFIAILAVFADVQASSVVLGLFFGPVALGLYRIADRIMNSVVTMAMSAIQAASLPEFSRLQRDPENLRRSVLTCIRLTCIVTVPALAGLAAVARPLMATIGPGWTPAHRALEILCVLGIGIVFAYFTAPLLQALSRTRELAFLEWGRTALGIVTLIGMALLVRQGNIVTQITGIALARFIVGGLLVTPVFVYIVMRLCNIRILDIASLIAPSLISAAAIVASVLSFSSTGYLSSKPPLLNLSVEIIIGAVVGVATLLIMDSQLRRLVESLIANTFSRRLLSRTSV